MDLPNMRKSQYYDEPERRSDMQLRMTPVYNVQDKTHVEEPSFTHTIRHIWPLIFGLAFLAGSSYGVATLVKTYEVDPTYLNMTFAEFREEQVLGEQCRAVDHAVPWKELQRKIRGCRRFEYYDPMHNDCQACPAHQPTDKVFAVFWETQSNCQHNPFYDLMAKHLPERVLPAIKDPNKIVLGACTGQGCVLPQPDGQDVMNAGNGSAYYGGTTHADSCCL
ncbi:hypothetical protein B5M09_003260 [Aphanomyces astaci]|uniref:Uncharacterized protein n=1 Tax=Aphanomyces astaci TaxID=112090 RepID=A0A425DA71_APHAT|nr:hypothetical protein B5M09_003260 [Aphanomyces astaci]